VTPLLSSFQHALRNAAIDMRIVRMQLGGDAHWGPVPEAARARAVRQLTYGISSALDAMLSTEQWEQICELECRYPECAARYYEGDHQ
jgi:hypothetical protein